MCEMGGTAIVTHGALPAAVGYANPEPWAPNRDVNAGLAKSVFAQPPQPPQPATPVNTPEERIAAKLAAYQSILAGARMADAEYAKMREQERVALTESLKLEGDKQRELGVSDDLIEKSTKAKLYGFDQETQAYLKNIGLINVQAQAYADMLSSGTLTAEQMNKVWTDSLATQRKLIENQRDVDILAGMDPEEARRKAEFALKMVDKAGVDMRTKMVTDLASAEESGLKSMLDDNTRSRDDLLGVWAEYAQRRMALIHLGEVEQLKVPGTDPRMVQQFVDQQLRDLEHERLATVGSSMEKWAAGTGQSMSGLFEETFFSVMKNDFSSLLDFMNQMINDFIRSLSQMFSQAIINMMGGQQAIENWMMKMMGFGGGQRMQLAGVGAGAGVDLSSVGHFAAGGMVDRPTLAVVGEAGPEAIIPVSRVPNGGGGGLTVNIHNNTPANVRVEQGVDPSVIDVHIENVVDRAFARGRYRAAMSRYGVSKQGIAR